MDNISHLGNLPFCILETDQNGNEFQEWDGVTFFQAGPAYANSASGSNTELILVYGTNTERPFGLTLEELSEMFWRVRGWEIGIDTSPIVVDPTPAKTASGGGYYDWVPYDDDDIIGNGRYVWTPTDSVSFESLSLPTPAIEYSTYTVERGWINEFTENTIQEKWFLCGFDNGTRGTSRNGNFTGIRQGVNGFERWSSFDEVEAIEDDFDFHSNSGVAAIGASIETGVGASLSTIYQSVIKKGDLYYPHFPNINITIGVTWRWATASRIETTPPPTEEELVSFFNDPLTDDKIDSEDKSFALFFAPNFDSSSPLASDKTIQITLSLSNGREISTTVSSLFNNANPDYDPYPDPAWPVDENSALQYPPEYGAQVLTQYPNLVFRASKWWPYKNSEGQPVWNEDTGEQINSVF